MTGIKAPDSMSHDSHGHEAYVPVFTGDAGDELRMLLSRYPTKMAALLPALWIVQRERGWVSDEAMAEVAEFLELTPAYVKGVVTFYTMYHQHPVGKYFVQVCTTSPCGICGLPASIPRITCFSSAAPCPVRTAGTWWLRSRENEKRNSEFGFRISDLKGA